MKRHTITGSLLLVVTAQAQEAPAPFPAPISAPATVVSGQPARAADLNERLNYAIAAINQNREELARRDFCPTLVGHGGVVRRYWRQPVDDRIQCVVGDGQDTMVKVGDFWIDQYEALLVDHTAWNEGTCNGRRFEGARIYQRNETFPPEFPGNGNWSPLGGGVPPVYACSVSGNEPTRSVTWYQAAQACAIVGKRLCTNAEWQTAAAGTPDPNINDGRRNLDCHHGHPGFSGGGQHAAAVGAGCVSRWGVEDMSGNVSEWVADWYAAPGATYLPGPIRDIAGLPIDTPLPWTGAGTTGWGDWGPDHGNDMLRNVGGGATVGGVYRSNRPAAALRGGGVGETPEDQFGIWAMDLKYSPADTDASAGFRCCASR